MNAQWNKPTTTVYPAADEVLLSLAELKRLREVETLARDLTGRVVGLAFRRSPPPLDQAFCVMCLENWESHADTCLITRARQMGLLE